MLRLRMEWGDEELAGVEVRPGIYQLTSFSEHVPLAAGDLVKVEGDVVTGVERLADVFLVEAYFKMFATEGHVAEVAREWHKACPTQVTSALTVTVASSSWEWITDQVIGHPDVQHFEVERRPGESFDFEQAVRDA